MNGPAAPGGAPDLIRVGHVLSPLGLTGAVKLYVIGDPAALLGLARLHVAGHGWLRLTAIQPHGPGVAVTFAGVASRDAAERLAGAAVSANEADLPPLPDDEFYYHELRGLPVQAPNGDPIGEVEDVQDAGAQDLLVVRHARGSSLVPLQAPYVTVERGSRVVLDAPPGLLDDDAENAG